jgi:hypothetical protein
MPFRCGEFPRVFKTPRYQSGNQAFGRQPGAISGALRAIQPQHRRGVLEQSGGEVFASIQAVILPGNKDKRPTVSAQYLRRLYPSPAPELDLGTFVQSATILLNGDLGGFHVDMNGLVMEQQDDATTLRRAQFAQTLSISHPIGRFTVSSEVWHFAQPLIHGCAVGNLWAARYPVRNDLAIDTGFDHGLTGTSTHWRALPVSPTSCLDDCGIQITEGSNGHWACPVHHLTRVRTRARNSVVSIGFVM